MWHAQQFIVGICELFDDDLLLLSIERSGGGAPTSDSGNGAVAAAGGSAAAEKLKVARILASVSGVTVRQQDD
jgi:hypothetical protein